MGLRIYTELEQGSDQWLAARCGLLTASTVGRLITPTLKTADNDASRGLTLTLAAERITGRSEDVYVTADMERGNLDEPICRDHYSEHHAPVTQIGFMVREINGHRLGFSPDGLVGEDGLIEAKSRKPKVHLATILADAVPAENMAQCQAGLLVSGRAWIDYLSWSGGLPMWRKRVFPDQQWFDAITNALEAFEKNAADMVARYENATRGLPGTQWVDHFADMEMVL